MSSLTGLAGKRDGFPSHTTELSGSYATLELPVEFGLVGMQIAELIEKSESQTL